MYIRCVLLCSYCATCNEGQKAYVRRKVATWLRKDLVRYVNGILGLNQYLAALGIRAR
jgi:hypothetical protein